MRRPNSRVILAASDRKGAEMSVAKVTEISASSDKSFEEAIGNGIAKASETVRDIRGAWVKEQQVKVDDGKIAEYRVDLKVTFVLE
jgi:dodecin